MIVKTAFALFAAGTMALGTAGMVRAQAQHVTGLVQLAQASNKNNQQKNRGQKTVTKNPGTKKFVGQKTGTKKFTGTKTTVKKSTVPHHNTQQFRVQHGKKITTPNATVHAVHAKRPHSKTVTAKHLRGLSANGVGHAYIRGHSYSTWRHERYRRRYHNAWVTFVPLSVLAAILIDDQRYYPYAYLDAPQDYCDGRTEDGCQLVWDEVETLEGDLVDQCVAYCPWQD
jgi:hypothetical protein